MLIEADARLFITEAIDTDKELQQIESTLQRTHLKYLLQNDPELVEI